MATRLDQLWADYEEHHRTAGNKWCHMVGIPLIAFSLLGLLAVEVYRVGAWSVELSLLLLVLTAQGYIRLDARLGAALTVFYVALYLGARLLSWQVNLGLFVLGWVFQFIGHGVFEKRSPAFFRNLVHLRVGPLWVANHILHLRPEQPVGAAPQN